MESLHIKYRFTLPDGEQVLFDLTIDPKNIELIDNIPETLPSWAKLNYHQCSNCPLSIKKNDHCPLAANLVNIVNRFDRLVSHNEMQIEVVTVERTISQNTTVQEGISSMMGLVIATSGCPHTAFFKPMARFHMPLSSMEETIFRSASTFMLAQYYRHKDGKKADLELNNLAEKYQNMKEVNAAIADRLRSATATDSLVNAIIVLDMYAQTLSLAITSSLDEIRYLFSPFLDDR